MDISQYAQYLNILFTDNVWIFEPAPVTDTVYGSVSPGWVKSDPIQGSVQAYSGDLAFKEYGMHSECKNRVFLPPTVTVSEGWGVAFSDADTPELYVKWAAQNKTHLLILAGTRD